VSRPLRCRDAAHHVARDAGKFRSGKPGQVYGRQAPSGCFYFCRASEPQKWKPLLLVTLRLPPKDDARAGLATVLADMCIGVFAELEKPIAVAAALLVERAVVAVAFLMDDAEIVAAALGDAGDVADAVLPDRAAFDFVDQCIKTQTGLEHTV